MTGNVKRFGALNKDSRAWLDFSMNKLPKCPHCGTDYDIDEHGAWELYDENFNDDLTCDECNMTFSVSVQAIYRFSTDCQEADIEFEDPTE